MKGEMKLEFYDIMKIENKIKFIIQHKIFDLDYQTRNLYFRIFNDINNTYDAYQREKLKYTEYAIYNIYNHHCKYLRQNSRFYLLNLNYKSHDTCKYYDVRKFACDLLRYNDYNEQCKNHINLNLLKQSRIPNDVIYNIIKHFL